MDGTNIQPEVSESDRVLVVDHISFDAELAQVLLENVFPRVEIEACAERAVSRIRSSADGQDYGAILINLRVPDLGGIQATQQIREAGFTGPIFGIHSRLSRCTREQWIAAGCNACLEKPLDLDQLLSVLVPFLYVR